PFDPAAAAAFMLAECAGEERYFSMIDVLFEKQATWKSGNVVEELFNISKLAGFTQESFNACLKNQELLDNVLSIQKKAAEDYGVNATPTFFINGTRYSGSMSAEDMGQVIESLV
ncbi:MAG: thioredoxin domain-containing protein, partial [Pseudomonadota bacterium]